MKSRLFRIIIAAEFEQEQDHASVADAVLKSLATEGIPRGTARVVAEALPEENYRLPREALARLN